MDFCHEINMKSQQLTGVAITSDVLHWICENFTGHSVVSSLPQNFTMIP